MCTELLLEDNPIADKRLYKLILQCRTKQILDYVKQHGSAAPKEDPLAAKNSAEASADGAPTVDAASASAATTGGKNKKESSAPVHLHRIHVQRHTDTTLRTVYTDAVRDVRPHILCCIVRNISLADPVAFKRFLQIQTRLHDTVCNNREKSTIATHDLVKIRGGFVRYTAKPPNRLQIVPLGKTKLVSGERLYNGLKAEAEALRKEKKRNVYSGIHKYLYLLERMPVFACMEDGEKTVISLPPLTNAEVTKVCNCWRFFIFCELCLIYTCFIVIRSTPDLARDYRCFRRSDERHRHGRLSGRYGRFYCRNAAGRLRY